MMMRCDVAIKRLGLAALALGAALPAMAQEATDTAAAVAGPGVRGAGCTLPRLASSSKATCCKAAACTVVSPSSKAAHSLSPSERGSRPVMAPKTTSASR